MRIHVLTRDSTAEIDHRWAKLQEVSEREHQPARAVVSSEDLDPADRVWLEERLVEYRERPPIPARPLNRPTVALVVAINRSVRGDDEWFDEPDDLDRVAGALAAIDLIEDPVEGRCVIGLTCGPGAGIRRRQQTHSISTGSLAPGSQRPGRSGVAALR